MADSSRPCCVATVQFFCGKCRNQFTSPTEYIVGFPDAGMIFHETCWDDIANNPIGRAVLDMFGWESRKQLYSPQQVVEHFKQRGAQQMIWPM